MPGDAQPCLDVLFDLTPGQRIIGPPRTFPAALIIHVEHLLQALVDVEGAQQQQKQLIIYLRICIHYQIVTFEAGRDMGVKCTTGDKLETHGRSAHLQYIFARVPNTCFHRAEKLKF